MSVLELAEPPAASRGPCYPRTVGAPGDPLPAVHPRDGE